MINEGWDVIMERVEKLGLHIDVGELDWMTMILDYAEQIKEARDEAEAKLAKALEALEWCAKADHSIMARFALAELKCNTNDT